MLLKIFTLSVSCFLSFLATAQIFPHHLKEDNLKGKVKSIEIVTNKEVREIYLYDTKGNQTERWFFKPVEVLDHRFKAVYNEKSQLLEETKFDRGISPVTKYVYGYNTKGLNIGRSLFSQNNTLLEKFIFQYDTANRMTDSIKIDTYGAISEKYSFQYDDKGHRTSIRKFWQDSLLSILDYIYNGAGKIIKEKKYSTGDKGLDYDAAYTYDQKGNKIAEERHFPDYRGDYKKSYTYDSTGHMTSYSSNPGKENLKEKFIYVYDKMGNKIEESHFEYTGILLSKDIFKYDEKNNQVEMIRYDQSGKQQVQLVWKYEYDAKGNWTKKEQFVNDKPVEMIAKEITYY